jgi:hypothetical protein
MFPQGTFTPAEAVLPSPKPTVTVKLDPDAKRFRLSSEAKILKLAPSFSAKLTVPFEALYSAASRELAAPATQ